MRARFKSVAVLHNKISADASKDELDVLVEVNHVADVLNTMGYEVFIVPFSLDFNEVSQILLSIRPDFVFNLVESVENDGQLIHLAPSILDHLKIPYSGCPKDAIYLTSNKLLAKKYLRASGIPTPDWMTCEEAMLQQNRKCTPFILKSVWEHASIGLDEDSVMEMKNPETLREVLKKRRRLTGKEFFAEEYVDGREFNVSILAGDVMPIPEIKFVDYPRDKIKVVGYRAKWEEDSFEYTHTVRSFDYDQADQAVHQSLSEICRKVWRVFGMKGYGRVDFRVGADGVPQVVDINTNPCISPDGGFCAATAQAGLSIGDVMERIIADSVHSASRSPSYRNPAEYQYHVIYNYQSYRQAVNM
ncbi:MAG: ATP-grasp domain-containing protein [Candidatus Delongbacteria bacterium]|nr:ATP-grasp domain-containing protein [Candidatus Delongbacteria bacterium]